MQLQHRVNRVGPFSNDTVTNFYRSAHLRSGLAAGVAVGRRSSGAVGVRGARGSAGALPCHTLRVFVPRGRFKPPLPQLPDTPYGTWTYASNGNMTRNGLLISPWRTDPSGVTQTCSLLFRRFVIGRVPSFPRRSWPVPTRRRLKTCETADYMSALRKRPDASGGIRSHPDICSTTKGAGGIGGLLARTVSGASAYYHADGNGNITYLMNNDQSLGANYKYDPYGNTLSSSGSLATANVYRFSSKKWLNNWRLAYYGYRFYSPSLQRWVNRDPMGILSFRVFRGNSRHAFGDDINPYHFVNNSPAHIIDPLGLSPLSDCLHNAFKTAKNCANNVSKWCGNIFYNRTGLIVDSMICSHIPSINGIIAYFALKQAMRIIQGVGTVASVTSGAAVCALSYSAEVEACKAVYDPCYLPNGPKY